MMPLGMVASARVETPSLLSYLGKMTSVTSGVSHTFTAMPLDGKAYLVIAVSGYIGGNRVISSVTVNGSPAYMDVNSNQTFFPTGIAYIKIPPGTMSADVVVTYNNTITESTIFVYSSAFWLEPYGAGTFSNPTTSHTLPTTAGGQLIGVLSKSDSTAEIAYVGITKRDRNTVGVRLCEVSDAPGTGALTTVSATSSGGQGFSVASYRAYTPGTTIGDDFNRANIGAVVLSSTGNRWINLAGSIAIATNVAQRGTSPSFSVMDIGVTDMRASAIVPASGGQIAARVVNTTNYYMATISTSAVRINKMEAGVTTSVTPTTPFAAGNKVSIQCREIVDGTELSLYVNDVLIYTAIDASATRPMATRAGLNFVGGSTPRFDNFQVEAAA